MVRQPGFEPGTHGLEGRCSIQLSYWRKQSLPLFRAIFFTIPPPVNYSENPDLENPGMGDESLELESQWPWLGFPESI